MFNLNLMDQGEKWSCEAQSRKDGNNKANLHSFYNFKGS